MDNASDEQQIRIYKHNVFTGSQALLRGAAREAVFNDWNLLNPLYRYVRLPDDTRAFAYARNHQTRVRVEPIRAWDKAKHGEAEVYVEWRGGQSRRLIRKGEHQWMRIHPMDISEDGQWVLLKGENLHKEVKKTTETIRSELIAWNVQTTQHCVYVSVEYPPSGMSNWQFVREVRTGLPKQ